MREAAGWPDPLSAPGAARFLSDERLARRAAAGDRRAFAAIFGRHHQGIYRYCLAILGDAQEAQDALQNTMVKAMRALPDESRQIRLKPWLYRIAHNESIDLVRGRRRAQPLQLELEAVVTEPPEKAEWRDRLRGLLGDLERLPERPRGALVMRELGGLSFEEIGEALGATPAAARQAVYEARLGLRRMQAGREMACDAVTRALSDADGGVRGRADVRAHLHECEDCRAFAARIRARRSDLGAVAPLPAAATAAILRRVAGAHGGAGGGVAAALGGGGKVLGGSVALKSAATLAVVAAVGAGAVERDGLLDNGAAAAGPGVEAPSRPGGIGPGTPAARGRAIAGPTPAAGGAPPPPGSRTAASVGGEEAAGPHAESPGTVPSADAPVGPGVHEKTGVPASQAQDRSAGAGDNGAAGPGTGPSRTRRKPAGPGQEDRIATPLSRLA